MLRGTSPSCWCVRAWGTASDASRMRAFRASRTSSRWGASRTARPKIAREGPCARLWKEAFGARMRTSHDGLERSRAPRTIGHATSMCTSRQRGARSMSRMSPTSAPRTWARRFERGTPGARTTTVRASMSRRPRFDLSPAARTHRAAREPAATRGQEHPPRGARRRGGSGTGGLGGAVRQCRRVLLRASARGRDLARPEAVLRLADTVLLAFHPAGRAAARPQVSGGLPVTELISSAVECRNMRPANGPVPAGRSRGAICDTIRHHVDGNARDAICSAIQASKSSRGRVCCCRTP